MFKINCHLKPRRYNHSHSDTQITETQRSGGLLKSLLRRCQQWINSSLFLPPPPNSACFPSNLRVQGNLPVPDSRHPATNIQASLTCARISGLHSCRNTARTRKKWGKSGKISRRGRPNRKHREGGHSPHQLRGPAELRSPPARSHHHALAAELVQVTPGPGFYVISRAPAP